MLNSEYSVNSNANDAKFKIGDHVKNLKYKEFFGKGYAPIWSEEDFVISKVNSTVPWTYLMISTVKKLMESFMKKNCRKQIKLNLGSKK